MTSAQTTLNLSRDLVPLKIAATNTTPNQPALDSGPLLTQGVEYAKNHGIARIIADPGAYCFLSVIASTHVQLNGVNDILGCHAHCRLDADQSPPPHRTSRRCRGAGAAMSFQASNA